MNCFNHPASSAIGTCKACSRGLCAECAVDLEHGLACKNKHEAMVETYNMIISKNAQVYSAAPKNLLVMPLFYLFMGVLFAAFGASTRRGMTDLTFILGVGFIVFAGVLFIRNRATFRDGPPA